MSTDQVVSITSKGEKSSACSSLVPAINHSHNMMPEAAECSMCGDVGLPQYLFKCLACSHRYQHIYCCQFYPFRMEARTCNWCLVPMDRQENHTAAATHATHSYIHPADIVDRRKQKLEQHTRAFEYLLQVAELHDQGREFDCQGCPIEADSCLIVPGLSEKTDVGADHTRKRTRIFHKLDHGIDSAENAASTPEPSSLEVHKMIFGDCKDKPCPREGGCNVGYYIGDLSATTMQFEHNHGQLHAYAGHDQRPSSVVNQGVDKSRIIKESFQTLAGHDQIPCTKLLYQNSSGHNLTTRKLNGLDLSPLELDILSAKVNQSVKRPDNFLVSKSARLHKQSQASLTAGRDQGITAAGEQTMTSQALVNSLAFCKDTISEDQPPVGEKCRTGPANKRPRHRPQSGPQAVGDESLNLAAGRRMASGNIDLDNMAVPIDHQGATSMKLQISSPTQLAWSSPARAAGKRDHLLSSPSRAINRRYKLLADVLC